MQNWVAKHSSYLRATYVLSVFILSSCTAKVDVYTVVSQFSTQVSSENRSSVNIIYKNTSTERFEYNELKMLFYNNKICEGEIQETKTLLDENGVVPFSSSNSGYFSLKISHSSLGEVINSDCLNNFYLGAPTLSIESPSVPINLTDSSSYQVSVSGTCVPDGSQIQADIGSLTPTLCESGRWSASWNFSSLTAGSYQANLSATYNSVNTSLQIEIIKTAIATVGDTLSPVMSGTVTDGIYGRSDTSTPNLSWSAGTDNVAIVSYELAVGSSAGATDISSGWVNIGNITSTSHNMGSAVFTNGSTYYPSIRAKDAQGNVSNVIKGDGWIVDTSAPDISTVTLSGQAELWDTATPPTLTWSAASDVGSGINHYEMAIGTSSGGSQILAWTSVGSGTLYNLINLGLTWNRGIVYYPSLRAVDTAGNFSSVVNGSTFQFNSELWSPTGTIHVTRRVGSKIYYGGSFSSVGPWVGGGIQLNVSDSSQFWPNSHSQPKPRIDGSVHALISDKNGGWFVGGKFTRIGQVNVTNLAHIRSDGTVDPAFTPNPNDYVYALALSSDQNKLYVGGTFTNIAGTAKTHLARVNTINGSYDSVFTPSANGGINEMVLSSNDAVLYVGGTFTSLASTTRNNLGAFNTSDGSIVSTFDPNPDSTTIMSLALSSNNSTLFAGGNFTNIGGQARVGLAAINATDGTAVSGFVADLNGGSYPDDLLLNSTESTLYIGGTFTSINSTTRHLVAAVSTTDGSLTSFNPNVSGGTNQVSTMALSPDNTRLFLGGTFTTVGASSARYFAVVNTSTSIAESGTPNFSSLVNRIQISSTGSQIFAGGYFTSINPTSIQNLAAVNTLNGQLDTAFMPNPNGSVTTMVASPDQTQLYIAGNFSTVNGTTRRNLAGVNLSDGNLTSLNLGSLSGGFVNKIDISSNGQKLYVGGFMSTVGGTSVDNIFAVDIAGNSIDGSFAPVLDGMAERVDDLVVGASDSVVYIAGTFTGVGGVSRPNLAALNTGDGSLVGAFNPNPDGSIIKLLLNATKTKLYVGGSYLNIGGVARSYLSRIHLSDASIDSLSTDISGGSVQELALNDDESILYIAGVFSSVGGQSRRDIASLTLSNGATTSFKPNFSGNALTYVRDLIWDPISKILFAASDRALAGTNSTSVPISPSTGNWVPSD